jgi:hypothetical protein
MTWNSVRSLAFFNQLTQQLRSKKSSTLVCGGSDDGGGGSSGGGGGVCVRVCTVCITHQLNVTCHA